MTDTVTETTSTGSELAKILTKDLGVAAAQTAASAVLALGVIYTVGAVTRWNYGRKLKKATTEDK